MLDEEEFVASWSDNNMPRSRAHVENEIAAARREGREEERRDVVAYLHRFNETLGRLFAGDFKEDLHIGAAKEGPRREDFCIHHGTHRCPHCAPPTLVEACEVIRGLLGELDVSMRFTASEQTMKKARDFLKRVEGKC